MSFVDRMSNRYTECLMFIGEKNPENNFSHLSWISANSRLPLTVSNGYINDTYWITVKLTTCYNSKLSWNHALYKGEILSFFSTEQNWWLCYNYLLF